MSAREITLRVGESVEPARRAEMHQEQVDELFGGAVSRGTRTIVQDVSSPVPDEVWIRVVAADDVLNFRLLAIGIGERRESK